MKSEDRESLNKSYRELLAYGTTQARGCNFLASHIHISSIGISWVILVG